MYTVPQSTLLEPQRRRLSFAHAATAALEIKTRMHAQVFRSRRILCWLIWTHAFFCIIYIVYALCAYTGTKLCSHEKEIIR